MPGPHSSTFSSLLSLSVIPIPYRASQRSLSFQPRIQKLQKFVSVHGGANLHVGVDVIDAFDDVAVAMQHIALNGVMAVGDRLAAREIAARFNVHMHRLSCDDRRINRRADSQRIVHWGPAAVAVFGLLPDQ